MRKWIMVAVVAAIAGLAAPAQAEWVRLPNGELGYAFDYSTSGVFTCAAMGPDIGSCFANGNTVTLERDGATMTMAYTGVSSTVTATNVSQLVSLGTITTTFGGSGPFAPPVLFSSRRILVGLDVRFASSIANDPVSGFCRPMSPRENGLVSYGTEYGCSRSMELHLPPAPPPAHYPLVVFDDIPHHLIGYEAGVYDFTATVGIIPEPGTWALLGTGLLGLAGVSVRRRRS